MKKDQNISKRIEIMKMIIRNSKSKRINMKRKIDTRTNIMTVKRIRIDTMIRTKTKLMIRIKNAIMIRIKRDTTMRRKRIKEGRAKIRNRVIEVPVDIVINRKRNKSRNKNKEFLNGVNKLRKTLKTITMSIKLKFSSSASNLSDDQKSSDKKSLMKEMQNEIRVERPKPTEEIVLAKVES